MFKLGDKVLWMHWINTYEFKTGIIIGINEQKYTIVSVDSSPSIHRDIPESSLYPISDIENVRDLIYQHYEAQIQNKLSKIKKVTSAEKQEERVKKYNSIKELIIKNCDRISTCTDDDEFENRLKEINKLKKELHTIDLECGDIIRKENGTIKYDAKVFERQRDIMLNNISDAMIEKYYNF